ncbi:hypothetical protein GO279_04174 [Ralstonia solanacearum]|nr:hypothetical protein [Ralstonia solanacearum]NKA85663.1 hypothetical protein [Ralstonia solanacearum]NKF57077.1 hypothetical protein [Ralstonia solanacearum]NKF66873.1 hypothetical protein [Ralstonia solanacearum]NKF72213.1 hypothetical protein [Ralstonia solanacearum]
MLAEGARVEGRVRLRVRGVAVAPLAAVHRIEIGGRPGHHPRRHASADDLAVGRHIGLDAVPGLRAARMQAEPHDDFVEDQRDAVLARQLAQRVQELARLPVGAAALHRLHQHRGQLVRVLADACQRFGRAVVEHDGVGGCAGLQAGRHRHGAGAVGDHQRVVAPAVIRAGEHNDLVAPGHRPGQAQGQHDRLGAGVAERHALQAGQPGDQLRHLAGQAGLGPQLQAGLQLGIERFLHKGRAMAEQVHAEAHGQVNVGVAVRVPEIGAFGALADDRIEHLLGGEPEAGRDPVVGQHRPVALHQRLGAAGALGVARDEVVQIGALPRAQAGERIGLGGDPDGLVGHVRLVRAARCGGGCRCRCRCDNRHGSGHDSGHNRRCLAGHRCRHTGRGGDRATLEQGQLPGRQLRQRVELLAQQPLQRRLRERGNRGKRWHGVRPRINRDRGHRRGGCRCGHRCRHRHHGSRRHRGRRLRCRLNACVAGHLPIHVVGDGGDGRQLLEQLAHGDRHTVGLFDAADGLHHHQRVRAQLQQRQVGIDPRNVGMQHLGDHAAQGTLNRLRTAGGIGNGRGHGGGNRHGSDGTGGLDRRLRVLLGSGRRIEPMAFALKGIGSQAQRAALLAGIERAPVERLPRQPELPGTAQQHREIRLGALAAAQRGQHEGVARARARQRAQRLARAHLDPGVRPALHQRLQAIGKAHRAAQMRRPVARIGGLGRLDPGTGQVGHKGNRRRPQGEPGHAVGKGRQDRLRHGRMERVRSRQAPMRDALGIQPTLQRRDRRCLAGHHAALAAVDRGQGQRPIQLRAQAGFVQRHAQHRAGGQALHQAATLGNQHQGVVDGKDAGQAGRHVFAHTVADQRGRLHAPVHPQPGERVLDDEQRGLRRLGPGQRQVARLGVAVAVERLDQIESRSLAQHLRAPIHHGAERGDLLVQLARHADLLRALPGKHEHHRCRHGRPHLRREHAPRIARAQRLGRVFAIAGHQHAPPGKGAAAGLVGIGRIGQGAVRQVPQLPGHGLGHRLQRGGRLGGQAQQMPGPLCPVRGGGGRRLRHDHVGQGAAEAERADAGMPAARVARPGLRTGHDGQRAAIQRAMRIGLAVVQIGGEGLVLEGQHHLDQAGHAGRRLQVADVGLDRADRAAARLGRMRKHALERVELDRVAERGAGAVGLDVADLLRPQARAGQRLAHHRGLRAAVGGDQAVAAPILHHRRAQDDRAHRIAVTQRVAQPLQHHDAAALAAHIAVGAGVERLAAPIRREHPGAGKGLARQRRQHQVHAPGQRQRRLAVAQALARRMHRHQRRRARRVDGQAGPAQVKAIRQAVGHDAARVARGRIHAQFAARAVLQVLVVVGGDTDEDAGGRAGQPGSRDARVLQGLPGHFQRQPLLRIHARGFERRNAEKGRVERIDPIEKAPQTHLRRNLGARLIEGARRTARLRHRADRIHLPGQRVPECVGVVRAGKAAAQADDGDRRVGRLHRRGRRRLGRMAIALSGSGQLGQKARQPRNIRMLPEHHRRDRHPHPDRQRLGQLHRRHRVKTVERERLFAIDRLGIQPQPRGQFGAQPGFDHRGRHRDGLARSRRRNRRPRRNQHRRGRQHRTIPAGHRRQAVRQEIGPALLPADLAAGRARNGPRLHQHDDVGRHADVHRHGRGHALEHAGLHRLAELQLLHDNELLRVVPVHGEGDGAVLAQPGVALERGQLHILRIDVEAVQNDQVLQATADVQLARVQETEIAGAQVALAVGRFRHLAGKAPPAVFVAPPIALRDAGAAHPDLADAAGLAAPQRLGIDDGEPVPGQSAAMAGQGDPVRFVIGRDRHALLQGRARKRQAPRLPLEPDGPAKRNQQGGLGHAVGREPGRRIEAVRREGRSEFLQRARAHRLGAAGEHTQAAQVQRCPLCRRDRAHAQVEGKVGRAGHRGAIVGDRLEPAIGVQQERRRAHQHHRAAQHQRLQDAADQAEVVVRRQPVDHDLVAPHPPLGGHRRDIGEQIAVGHHDALRGAGGTGRVLQERDARAVQPGVGPVARIAVRPVDRQPALDRQSFALLRFK